MDVGSRTTQEQLPRILFWHLWLWVVDPRRVTFFVNSDKETNERKRRPMTAPFGFPLLSLQIKQLWNSPKQQAQTATTESSLFVMIIMACSMGLKIKTQDLTLCSFAIYLDVLLYDLLTSNNISPTCSLSINNFIS